LGQNAARTPFASGDRGENEREIPRSFFASHRRETRVAQASCLWGQRASGCKRAARCRYAYAPPGRGLYTSSNPARMVCFLHSSTPPSPHLCSTAAPSHVRASSFSVIPSGNASPARTEGPRVSSSGTQGTLDSQSALVRSLTPKAFGVRDDKMRIRRATGRPPAIALPLVRLRSRRLFRD